MLKLNKKNLAFFFLLLFLVLTFSSFVPFLRTPVLSILRLPLNALTFTGREISGLFFFHRNMVQRHQFKNEAGLLTQRLNDMKEIEIENDRLRQLLSLKKEAPYKVIACRVIARSVDNWSSLVIIDKGSYHGIKKGFVVLSFEGLAGKVIETQSKTSKVILINDPNLSISALIQRSRQEGLVSGTLGNMLIMKYLPKEADVMISDVIITSGLTDSYPKGILIGTVVEVGEEFSGLSRYAIVKPNVNCSNLEEVLVIMQ